MKTTILLLASLFAPVLYGAEPVEVLYITHLPGRYHDYRAQMEAFKRDDGAAAFAFAAPNIKALFGTAELFMAMVRSQYAPVYRPRYVEFLEPLAAGDQFLQPLILTGEDGATVIARYALRRQASGDWRIIGVTLSPAPDQAPL